MKPKLPEGKFYALNRTPGHYVKRVTPDGHEEIYAGVRTYREAQALAAVLNLYPLLMRYWEAEAIRAAEVFDSSPDWARTSQEADLAFLAVEDALKEAGDVHNPK